MERNFRKEPSIVCVATEEWRGIRNWGKTQLYKYEELLSIQYPMQRSSSQDLGSYKGAFWRSFCGQYAAFGDGPKRQPVWELQVVGRLHQARWNDREVAAPDWADSIR